MLHPPSLSGWGAQAAMYHFYGLKKRLLPQKLFGLYRHKVENRKEPLIRGFDDEFYAPHSRHTTVDAEEIRACSDLTILAESDEAAFSSPWRRKAARFLYSVIPSTTV